MILVTGATGLVGQALVADLAGRGLPFRAVSRMPKAGYVTVGDITATTDWSTVLQGVTTVVHLAARTHVLHDTAADPLAAYRAINVEATVDLARQAAQAGVRRFVFMSSVKVNGERTRPGRPFREDDPPAPEDAYGYSKLEAETMLFALGRLVGMEVTVIRAPLIYGPGVKANFASLMKLARRGLPLPFGAVGNERSLVFVGNLADLIIRCLDHPQAANEVFLAGDAEAPSIGELVRAIASADGRTARLLPVPVALMERAAVLTGRQAITRRLFGSLRVDTGKARSLLGWVPPHTLAEGLRRTIAAEK